MSARDYPRNDDGEILAGMGNRPRYAPPTEILVLAVTKEEHDAHVEATGRPYTQPQWDTLGRKPPEHRPAERD